MACPECTRHVETLVEEKTIKNSGRKKKKKNLARNKAICSEEPNNKKQVSEDPRKKARACIVTCPLGTELS